MAGFRNHVESVTTELQSLKLSRWPLRRRSTLRAWDAADEYLLQHLQENGWLAGDSGGRLLIVNDAFGALSCALHRHSPVNWSDSVISHLAVSHNLRDNLLGRVSCLKSTDELSGVFDLVLIKVPKSNALLEAQLHQLRPHLNSASIIIGAGMIKHLPKSSFQCFERLIGPLTTSLAKKKARLIFAQFNDALEPGKLPYPTTYTDTANDITLLNEASLFSRNRLDPGTCFLLSQYAALPAGNKVVDLACGNGVAGIIYRRLHQQARMLFIDESYMAVASARANYESYFPQDNTARFEEADGMASVAAESVDLVLCNPPFHQQYVVGAQVALQMFRDSKRCLTPRGELWLVANRHLPYIKELKQIFGNCRTVATNSKFAVLRVTKR